MVRAKAIKDKTKEELEADIKALYPILLQYPDSETLHNKMYNLVSPWADMVNVIIYQSPEERYPWTEKELGHPVFKMPTKKECGYEQTGDYTAYVKEPTYEGYIPILIERKGGAKGRGGPNDFYATLSEQKRRRVFYNEIGRFYGDPRFTRMYIIAECSMNDYVKYIPCFNGSSKNENHTGMSVPSKEATIAGLFIRDCPVVFMSTRKRATNFYKNLIRQWILKNYATILKLDSAACTLKQ